MIQLAIEENRPLPRSIMEAPVLDDVTTEYYKAFGKLSRMRGFTSNGVSLPLTFEAVDGFARRFGFDDFDDFFNIIIGIDEEYLRQESKRKSAEQRKADKDQRRREKKRNHK